VTDSSRLPHWNQPGGPWRASTHANVAGRERELRAMADAVRRLVRVTINNTRDAAWTAAASHRLAALAAELEEGLPETSPPRYGTLRPPEEPHDVFPYDPVLGLYNPLALPIEMEWRPPRAVGRATFDTPYEGPPGCVHGAVLSAAFDQVFNVANILSGTAGPTATLRIDFRKPTPLHAPLVFEAWVEGIEGRKVTSRGQVSHEDAVTAEATGLFIAIDPAQLLGTSD